MAPTAAVAWVPKVPTMAVSIYCTAVCISSSSMVGHASAKMTDSIFLSKRLLIFLFFFPSLGFLVKNHYSTVPRGFVKDYLRTQRKKSRQEPLPGIIVIGNQWARVSISCLTLAMNSSSFMTEVSSVSRLRTEMVPSSASLVPKISI